MEGSTETAYKSQYTTTIGASIWTCTQPSVHSSSIYCSQDREATQVLINRLYNMYTHTHTHIHIHTYMHPWWLSNKESTCNAGDAGNVVLIPGLVWSSGGGHDHPPRYSCWESHMDRGAWWINIHGVAKSQTQLKWLSLYVHMHTHTCANTHSICNMPHLLKPKYLYIIEYYSTIR